LFVVDYLQLMHSTNKRAQNREQEIADISSGLKGMAKELNVPVIALAQLESRGGEAEVCEAAVVGFAGVGSDRAGRGSGGDFVQAENREGQEDEDGDEIKTNLHMAKQRNGPTGDVEFLFKRWCMKFEDAYGNTGHAPAAAGLGDFQGGED
jgi:replicative DNA helicase